MRLPGKTVRLHEHGQSVLLALQENFSFYLESTQSTEFRK